MSKDIIIKCDICGTAKGQSNHWWMIFYNKITRSVYSFPIEHEDDLSLRATFNHNKRDLYLCGLEHLTLAESRIRTGHDPITGIKWPEEEKWSADTA
jgi:hypothetical protein